MESYLLKKNERENTGVRDQQGFVPLPFVPISMFRAEMYNTNAVRATYFTSSSICITTLKMQGKINLNNPFM